MLENLFSLAPEDDIAALCAVVALLPELTRIARLLARGSLDAEEAQSEAIAIAWEVITESPDLRSETRGSDKVVSAIWNEARRSFRIEAACGLRT